MKKILSLFVIYLAVFSHNLSAQEAKQPPAKDWDFFSLCFFPGIPTSSDTSNTYGIKVGAPISGGVGSVGGIETAAFCCMSERVIGLQTAPLFCVSDKISGLQASPVNFAEESTGLQFGLVNISKKANIQIGIVNYIEDAACPFLPIINIRF